MWNTNLLENCPEACFELVADSGNRYRFIHPNKVAGTIRRKRRADAKSKAEREKSEEISEKALRIARYAAMIESGERITFIPRKGFIPESE